MEIKQIPCCFVCDEPLAPEGFSGEMECGSVYDSETGKYFATHAACSNADIFSAAVEKSGVYLGTKHPINRRVSFNITVPALGGPEQP
jgi:hypothetical protein